MVKCRKKQVKKDVPKKKINFFLKYLDFSEYSKEYHIRDYPHHHPYVLYLKKKYREITNKLHDEINEIEYGDEPDEIKEKKLELMYKIDDEIQYRYDWSSDEEYAYLMFDEEKGCFENGEVNDRQWMSRRDIEFPNIPILIHSYFYNKK